MRRNSTRSPQDLLIKTCARSCKDLFRDFTIFSQGPLQDHALQGPLRGFHQDLYISLQDLLTRNCKSLTKNFMPGPLGESHKIFIKKKRCCWRECYKMLQDLDIRTFQEISPGSPQDLLLRTCTGSCKDLVGRTSSRSPQDLLLRTCGRSSNPLRECQQGLHKIF